MRIGLNLLHLVPGETGGSETYARRLVPALLQAEPSLELTVFSGLEAASSLAGEPWSDEARLVSLPVHSRSRFNRVVAEQTLLPPAARCSRIELLHNLFTTAPALPLLPQVTTVHDLIYKRFPETHSGLLARGLALLVPLAARRSRRLIVPSEATKQDLVRFLDVDEDRIDVTYEGPGMEEPDAIVDAAALRERFGLGDAPVVLSVSAKRPHKNLGRLFDAFAGIETQPPPVLLLTGYATPFEADLRRRAGDRIRFAGWVEDEDLDGLYRAATCLAFPSLAEGFGLPVLEAMLRGLPVVCSNASSLPEVAGEAALLVDPTDTDALRNALERVLAEPELRTRLAAAGKVQARRFSWESTARATVESYRSALSNRS
jgi:glycosyltransferase involved in cell wall biosynthesis